MACTTVFVVHEFFSVIGPKWQDIDSLIRYFMFKWNNITLLFWHYKGNNLVRIWTKYCKNASSWYPSQKCTWKFHKLWSHMPCSLLGFSSKAVCSFQLFEFQPLAMIRIWPTTISMLKIKKNHIGTTWSMDLSNIKSTCRNVRGYELSIWE